MYPEQPTPMVKTSRDKWFMYFVIAAVASGILLILSVWALLSRNSIVNSRDADIDAAVIAAEAIFTEKLEADFLAEQEAETRTISMGDTLGKISLDVPKPWSAHLIDKTSGSKPIVFYAHPDFVPAIEKENIFAFRLELEADAYADVLDKYDRDIERGDLSSKVYKSNGATGVKLTGTLDDDKVGVLVLLPLRDKTLKIWTEANRYIKTYEQMLNSLKFTP